MGSELFGTFSEPVGLSVGDPFKQIKGAEGRFGGKQFSTVSSKTGKAPDAYIDKQVRSLADGDRYVDPWIREQRGRSPGQAVSNKPFYRRAAVNPSASCGPGSTDGCLSTVPLDTDGSAAALRSKHPRGSADKLRNIYTSSPKRGGPGMPWRDMTLGEPPKYYVDAYEGGRAKEKELAAHLKPVRSKPFVSMGAPCRPFTPDAQLCQTGSAVHGSSGKANSSSSSSSSAPGSRPDSSKRASSAPRERPQSVPWRPSSPAKQGAAFCVLSTACRNYVPDPVREAKFHARQQPAVKPFRPCSASKARLSMWSPNPFATAPRPPPDIDFTLQQ